MRRTLSILCASLTGLLLPQGGQARQATGASEWWRSAVCYEVFVRSFFDSDGDGVGDLRGLTSKLDYINDGDARTSGDLGADCIWLMPIAQSPSYHGYDVTNYYAVNRDYGTREDFTRFMDEAHRRGIRVIVDLVLNHTSNEHPWFKSAVLDARSPFRDWYLWSPSVRPSPGWEAPVWHRINTRDEYYYGLFWSGMPDLNLANPAVRSEAERVARFWVDSMKVDGFRLDAVAHFFEESDGRWKHAAAVYPWLRDYAAAVHRMRPGLFTVGEVYDDLDSVKRYYPDQLDSYFMFEVADAVIESVRSGVKQPLIDIVGRVAAEIPAGRGSTFLRNHDQTRTMTELAGDVARAKLAATLLFTLPGIPFVYYGEEIGMTGAKPAGDPRLRTPMQWTRAPAAGFTTAMPWEPLQPDSFTANVAAQTDDASSLLSAYRTLIRLRSERPGLAAGAFVPLVSADSGALAFVRPLDGRALVVIANLGATLLSSVRLSSARGALPPGRYRASVLLGEGTVSALRVGGDGRVNGWTPLRAIPPRTSVVIELVQG